VIKHQPVVRFWIKADARYEKGIHLVFVCAAIYFNPGNFTVTHRPNHSPGFSGWRDRVLKCVPGTAGPPLLSTVRPAKPPDLPNSPFEIWILKVFPRPLALSASSPARFMVKSWRYEFL
jgi:hypothetical protein